VTRDDAEAYRICDLYILGEFLKGRRFKNALVACLIANLTVELNWLGGCLSSIPRY
jgi:hypothetical protein